MSTETTPQAPREERTDKKYYTASGEDITHIAAPAEKFVKKFVKKFCPAELETNNNAVHPSSHAIYNQNGTVWQ